ncbi:sperm-associated antigen 16 protein [Hippoglossus hippoglossus]|uniref:sperm-associated antigen 16 protein n=1 Tax=Hippoglossus hippoglossus TaxID=8267 RepID=UPI00148E2DC6|nr:sperm-associated antigen 16 protein [Hippoglossus hippoglossus]
MSAAKKNTKKDGGGAPIDSEEDFQYEEVSLEDDWSLTEGEEDLEATLKAIQTQAEANARPVATGNTRRPEAVDDFLRNFLLHAGMTQTLECFQAEWNEIEKKGLVDAGRVGVVPGVYTDNQRLDTELKHARRERDEYRREATALAQALVTAQRARDLQRLQLTRLVQEKNRLVADMRMLKVQCDGYEPALQKMNEKYQAVLKTFQRGTMVKSAQHTGSK